MSVGLTELSDKIMTVVAVCQWWGLGLPPTTISFTKFALTLTFVNFSFRFPEDTLVGGDKETGILS